MVKSSAYLIFTGSNKLWFDNIIWKIKLFFVQIEIIKEVVVITSWDSQVEFISSNFVTKSIFNSL